jgi:hypothetical protein
VWPQRTRHQPEPANEQDQHHQRIEKAGLIRQETFCNVISDRRARNSACRE